jgi:hypothetical protein
MELVRRVRRVGSGAASARPCAGRRSPMETSEIAHRGESTTTLVAASMLFQWGKPTLHSKVGAGAGNARFSTMFPLVDARELGTTIISVEVGTTLWLSHKISFFRRKDTTCSLFFDNSNSIVDKVNPFSILRDVHTI